MKKLQPHHDICFTSGFSLYIINMFMPRTIVEKKYTKMFMRFFFCHNLIFHKERWMYMFIKFTRDKKRLCFLGIKRDKPSFCPGHNFFKIQIEKFISGI